MIEEIITLKNNATGGTFKALWRKPVSMAANPTKKYPVWFFLHGVGEAVDNLAKIYNNIEAGGPANLIERGLLPASLDDIHFVSPQAPGTNFSSTPDHVYYMVKDFMARYQGDPGAWCLSGLSAGGASVLQYIANESPTKINYDLMPQAAIIMSHAAGTISLDTAKKIVARNVKVWVFIGDQDKTVSVEANKAVANLMNQAQADSARLTVYANGHNSWNNYFSPLFVQDGKSIYDYFRSAIPAAVVTPPVTVPPVTLPPVTTPPVVTSPATKTIIAQFNVLVYLDGSTEIKF